MILVRAFPRLHVGLVDLGNATARRYGGAGFMLDWSPVEVIAEPAKRGVLDLTLLDRRGNSDVLAAIKRLEQRTPLLPMRLVICQTPPQHVGLGTKTAVILAVQKAIACLNDAKLTPTDLQFLSGRGGASGVGIHGFFRGGFIVDAGHVDQCNDQHLPSGANAIAQIPALSTRVTIPKEWQFVLIRPKGIRYSGGREVGFFRRNTPIPASEVKDTLAALYHGVVPAIIERNIQALRASLLEMHEIGFKKRELDGQRNSVRRLLQGLASVPECAAGMSSMGPLVYAVIHKGLSSIVEKVTTIAALEGAIVLGTCTGRNRAHEVKS